MHKFLSINNNNERTEKKDDNSSTLDTESRRNI